MSRLPVRSQMKSTNNSVTSTTTAANCGDDLPF